MASKLINVTWTPPPEASLLFVNNTCAPATRWYAAALNAAQDGAIKNDVASGLVYEYLTALVPKNYTHQPNWAEVMVWYFGGMSMDLLQQLGLFPFDDCGKQVCEYIEWPGDPDITGVGMMISYYLAAIFTTIYFIVLTGSQLQTLWERARDKPRKPRRFQKFLDGFSESVNTFLDAALIFAVSMLVAATTRYASVLRNPNDHYSIYQLLGSVYMSTFAIFPALALQSIGGDLRRHWLRLVIWLVVIVFAIVVDVMYRDVYKSRGWNRDDAQIREALELVWLNKCDAVGLRMQLEKTVTAGHVALAINLVWWVYYAASSLAPDTWKSKTVKKSRVARGWRTIYPYLRLFNGLTSLILMWVFLELFAYYRDAVARNSGKAYEDNKWTFGQVLSVATWAPVLIDLAAIASQLALRKG